MSLAIVVPPYAEPISLLEMKNHLKVEQYMTEDDVLIGALTTSARDVIETATSANGTRSKVMLATTFDLTLDRFPFPCRSIKLSRVPLISVTSITYVDAAGSTQTLSSSDYVVDVAGGKIDLDYGAYWPATLYQPNSVTVRFVAGLAATFTADASTDIPTFKGRSFTTGDRIRVMNSGGSLPAPLVASTDYFVLSSGKLALTSGGSAIDLTAATGSGTNFAGPDLSGFESLRSAIKLLVGHWYINRSAVVMGQEAFAAREMPMAVDALVSAQHA